MRMIGTIKGGDDAERFSDYLVTQNVANMVEESSSGDFSVWVEHDDDLDRAKGELDRFLKNPNDAKFEAAQDRAQKIRDAEQKKAKKKRAKFVDVRTNWSQPSEWVAPLTIALIVASMGLSIGTGSVWGPTNDRRSFNVGARRLDVINTLAFAPTWDPDAIIKWLGTHPFTAKDDIEFQIWVDSMKHGQVWRLITPIFLHLGILHLLFNMFWLRDLGGMIEIRRGTWVLAIIVLLGAIISNFGEFFWSGAGFGGMSGVLYALFGYIWIKQRYEPQLGLGLSQETSLILMGWLVICMTGWMGPVANAAHVVGLASGAAIGFAPVAYRRGMRGR
jgi:GlpG protein